MWGGVCGAAGRGSVHWGGREGIRTLSDNMIHVGYKLDLMYTREFGNVWREIRIK